MKAGGWVRLVGTKKLRPGHKARPPGEPPPRPARQLRRDMVRRLLEALDKRLMLLSADLRPIGGDERYEADRRAGRITHQVSLRYRAGVAPAMRFRKGTRIFHIVSAIDVQERKRWLTCLCEEREL